MKWKKRKASSVLFPYLKRIFQREEVPYAWEAGNGFVVVSCPVSNFIYNRIRDDAKCLLEQEQSGTPDIPVIPYWRFKKQRPGAGAFYILSSDEKKFHKLTDLKPVPSGSYRNVEII